MYLEIDEGFPGHRKTLRLCSLMNDPKAGWHMVWLWTWACRSCKSGDLSGMGAFEVEEAARYQTHDGKLCSAMIEAGFIDADDSGRPIMIHNWMKRTGAAILKMEAESERKKLYRAHRDKKCGQSCQFCGKERGQSTDGTGTVRMTSLDETAPRPDQTRPDQTRPDKTSQERDTLPRAIPVAVAGSTPMVPHNEPGKPTARNVLAMFGAIRAETCGGKSLFWQPSGTQVSKVAAWLAETPEDAIEDIEPAIRMACEGVRDCAAGWTDKRMADPAFLLGAILSRWSSLREELHGCAPKKKPDLPQFDHGMDLVVR